MNKMVHDYLKKVLRQKNTNPQRKANPLCAFVPLCLCAFFLISTLPLLFTSCTPTGTPIFTLGAPHFVPQSSPRDSAETGISQDPNTGGIFLQWFKTDGAAGYKIYRTSTASVNGTPINFVDVKDLSSSNALNDTFYVDGNSTSLKFDSTYFYCVQAYAPDMSTSNFSDTAHITLLNRPALISPQKNAPVDAQSLTFTWKDNANASYTLLRVKDISTNHSGYVWISRLHDDWYTGSNISERFNVDTTAVVQLISGDAYQWRVDMFNAHFYIGKQGDTVWDQQTKSAWQQFTVN